MGPWVKTQCDHDGVGMDFLEIQDQVEQRMGTLSGAFDLYKLKVWTLLIATQYVYSPRGRQLQLVIPKI